MPPTFHSHSLGSSELLASESKEDACASEGLQGQVRGIQELLDNFSQRIAKLHGAIRKKDIENSQLCIENAELKLQLALKSGSVRTAAFAGTGEMPNIPHSTCDVSPPPVRLRPVGSPTAVSDMAFARPPKGLVGLGLAANSLGVVDVNSEELEVAINSRRANSSEPHTPKFKDEPHTPKHKDSGGSIPARPAPLAKSKTRFFRGTGQVKKQGMFAEEDAMKEKVRQAIARPEYNVVNFYHSTGFCQLIARSQLFEYLTLAMIMINAIWTAVDAEFNTGDVVSATPRLFQVADNVFCVYFTIELLIRVLAFREKRNVLRDTWVTFDFILVIVMIGETWVMPLLVLVTSDFDPGWLSNALLLRLLRLVRVTRMARLVKLLRCVPELIVVVKGIGVALRSVTYTWLLLVGIVYIFAIAFRQATFQTGLGEKYFDGVFPAMLTLLLKGALPDLADFVDEVSQQDTGLAILLMIFIFLVSLTVMNMLIGILVDVVSLVSKVENYELHVAFVKHKLLGMLEVTGVDEDHNQCISRKEFENILVRPEAARVLQDLGVDPVGLVDFTDFIFEEQDELTFVKFMEVVLALRGSNTATVRDIVDMRKWAAGEFKVVLDELNFLSRQLTNMAEGKPLLRRSDNDRKSPRSRIAAAGSHHSLSKLESRGKPATHESRSKPVEAQWSMDLEDVDGPQLLKSWLIAEEVV